MNVRQRWRARTAPTMRRWLGRYTPTGTGSWTSRWLRRGFWLSKPRSRLVGLGSFGALALRLVLIYPIAQKKSSQDAELAGCESLEHQLEGLGAKPYVTREGVL